MGSFTIYFDGQFWVGLAVRECAAGVEVARVVFGPEPSDGELFLWLREHSHDLEYRTVDVAARHERSCRNPKRRQREAQRALEESSTRSRSQDAWRAAFEADKELRKVDSRIERREREQRKYQLRVEKRKRAKRGK